MVIVNWAFLARSNYIQAIQNAAIAGQKIANFIVALKIDLNMVHCIGYSLGAHVCGHCGKAIINTKNGKLGRISGKMTG